MSEKFTLTEALAEIKLIEKKIEKKKSVILSNLSRFEQTPDPFIKDGGAEKVLKSEQQSILDLQARHSALRSGIASANLQNTMVVADQTQSIYDWLTWKREIFPKYNEFLTGVIRGLKQSIDAQNSRPQVYTNPETKQVELCKLILNMDYSELLKKQEKLNELHDQLDGKLSLKNATTVFEI